MSKFHKGDWVVCIMPTAATRKYDLNPDTLYQIEDIDRLDYDVKLTGIDLMWFDKARFRLATPDEAIVFELRRLREQVETLSYDLAAEKHRTAQLTLTLANAQDEIRELNRTAA